MHVCVAINACQPASQPTPYTHRARTKYALHARDCGARAKMFLEKKKRKKKQYKSSPVGCLHRDTLNRIALRMHTGGRCSPCSRVIVSLVCARQRDREREIHKIIKQIKCDFGWFRGISGWCRVSIVRNYCSTNARRCVGTLPFLHSTSLIVTCQAVICEGMLITKQ